MDNAAQRRKIRSNHVDQPPPQVEQVAAERYPNGLPKPYSDDPTQWIFHGHPAQSDAPLQVAVARLLGVGLASIYLAAEPAGTSAADAPAQREAA